MAPIFFQGRKQNQTHLGVEAVAKLGDAAGDLVEVDRLLAAVPLDDVHLAHGLEVAGSNAVEMTVVWHVALLFPAIFSAPAHPKRSAGHASRGLWWINNKKTLTFPNKDDGGIPNGSNLSERRPVQLAENN